MFVDNFLEHVAGQPMTGSFDGHANCFVETGDGKALLIDFNYDTEPLPGRFPLPGVGPMSLLKETRVNHLGKLALPLGLLERAAARPPDARSPPRMSMAGKHVPTGTTRSDRGEPMPVTTIDGHEIHVDAEGFLTEHDEWDETLGHVPRRRRSASS